MKRVFTEYINLSKMSGFRVNRDNSEYEIKKGELVQIVELVDKDKNKIFAGMIGVADGPKKIKSIMSISKLREYNNGWRLNDNISLYRGDKIYLLKRKEEIIL